MLEPSGRPMVAGPCSDQSPEAEGIKVLARTHKTLIWERTRAVQRLRHQLREYFPATLVAFADLDAPGTLELLGKAPDPGPGGEAAPQVSAAMKRARRRNIPDKATAALAALRSGHLGQPEALTAAFAEVLAEVAHLDLVKLGEATAGGILGEADFG